VAEDWIRELIAAWNARDAGLPVPPVRWPDSEGKTREYLSHIVYDWPDAFVRSLFSKDLPDGSSWYSEINELVSAMGRARSRFDLALEPQTRTAINMLLQFVEPFVYYSQRRNDYGGSSGVHLLSPTTCAMLEAIYPNIDFPSLDPIVRRCVRENEEQEPDPECRWNFSGCRPYALLCRFCDHCFHCCQESRRINWALGLCTC
jgi:hypothetical protein